MDSIVLKFGGTSMCIQGFSTILDQIIKYDKNQSRVYIVVSAIKNTTNNLIKIINQEEDTYDTILDSHNKLLSNLDLDKSVLADTFQKLKEDMYTLITDPTIDITQQKIKILSYGEILSSIMLTEYLKKNKVEVKLINARYFIKATNHSSDIDPHNLNLKGKFYCDLKKLNFLDFQSGHNVNIYVTQGFIASTSDERFAILSRSGSDTTAALIASTINAKRLEIWTDVNGLYTANPKYIHNAQLIKNINYDICQELSASGSQVLHPHCIKPCQKANIDIHIKNTFDPDNPEFTVVSTNNTSSQSNNDNHNKIYAVSVQDNVTVFHIESMDMWEDYGFVADIFTVFSKNNIDVNIITTSQFSITTTTQETSSVKLDNTFKELLTKYKVKMTRECSIISIIADDILGNTQLSKSLKLVNNGHFRKHLHITHNSSNNLNLSLVVDEKICCQLVKILHQEFLLHNKMINRVDNMSSWWRDEKYMNKLLSTYEKLEDIHTAYVYNLEQIKSNCQIMKDKLSPSVTHFYYAMKANNNVDVLREIVKSGFGLECVSIGELKYIDENKVIEINSDNVLFTPNYCHINEYVYAFDIGVRVVIDNVDLLLDYPDIFRNKCIGIRLDLDMGDGHHKKVITEGNNVKFGLPLYELDSFIDIASNLNTKIVFIHSHKGSGILNHNAWLMTLEKMHKLLPRLPDVKTIDLGGGFGIFSNGQTLDLDKVNKSLDNYLEEICKEYNVELAIEPGRFVVAEAGIILTQVTQIRSKSRYTYLGVGAGMHTLIRPALYDAYHPIYNLSKIDKANNTNYQVVGPICETGDILGKDIMLPKSEIGDIILIENTGAYGQVMSSDYNMRNDIVEVMFE
jgi:diaminopimelate decarboxylase/aspartate kinase